MRRLIFLLLLYPLMETSLAADSVFLKLGYGGVWQFYDEPVLLSTPTSSTSGSSFADRRTGKVGIGDRLAFGVDLKILKQHALSGSFETGLAFPHRSLLLGGIGYKWFPLDWYNAPFIGAGINYFGLTLGTSDEINRFGVHLAYGLNIQFPENIFLIVDFKNIFFSAISNQTATERYTHFLVLTASLSYRIPIGN